MNKGDDDSVLDLLRRLFFRTSLSTFNQSNKQTNKDNKEILKKERKILAMSVTLDQAEIILCYSSARIPKRSEAKIGVKT